MNISTVNELIQSLESAGELSIREQKFLKMAKAFKKVAAENVGLKKFIKTECFVGQDKPDICLGLISTRYVSADGYEPETPATDRIVAGIKADAQSEVIEWLDAEITALDTMYRGDPSYEHDAYWMKSEALGVVELARNAFVAQLREGADK